MTPLDMIKAERKRQIEVEGYTAQHDDQHSDGGMLTAANFYYLHALGRPLTYRPDGAPLGWPWGRSCWKPKNPERDLVRAGALCMAELDRLRRIKGSIREHASRKLNAIVIALTPFWIAAEKADYNHD